MLICILNITNKKMKKRKLEVNVTEKRTHVYKDEISGDGCVRSYVNLLVCIKVDKAPITSALSYTVH